jgi:hypothetical protein
LGFSRNGSRLPIEGNERVTAVGVKDLDDDLFSPSAIQDPYTYLAQIREVDPVHWNPLHQLRIVTKYDHVA